VARISSGPTGCLRDGVPQGAGGVGRSGVVCCYHAVGHLIFAHKIFESGTLFRNRKTPKAITKCMLFWREYMFLRVEMHGLACAEPECPIPLLDLTTTV